MTKQARAANEEKRSEAYKAGYSITISAAHPNISPSLIHREDWSHAWTEFMQGWNAGKRASDDAVIAHLAGIRPWN